MVAIADPQTGEDVLRDRLRKALRTAGFGAVTAGESHAPQWVAPIPALALLVGALLGYNAALLSAGLPPALVVACAVVIAAIIVSLTVWGDPKSEAAAYVYLATVAAAAVVQAVAAGWEVLVTNVLPVAASWFVAFVVQRFERPSFTRAVSLAAGVVPGLPLLYTAIALVLSVLILTSEVWAAANAASAFRLAAVGVVVLVAVTLFLRRRLRAEVPKVLDEAGRAVLREHDPDEVAQALRATLGRRRAGVLDAAEVRRIDTAFRGADDVVLQHVTEMLERHFRQVVTTRLALLLMFVAATVFVAIYVLTSLTIDAVVAADWAGVGDESTPANVLTLGIDVPLGPHLKFSALLAILSIAVLPWIVADDWLRNIIRALLDQPARTAFLLAVPYLALEPRARSRRAA